MAYAEIAGVPPQHAFYAAPVALVAYAVFGSSRHLVVGATRRRPIMSAATVTAAAGTQRTPRCSQQRWPSWPRSTMLSRLTTLGDRRRGHAGRVG